MLIYLRGIFSLLCTLGASCAFADAYNNVTESTGRIGITDRIASVVFKVVAQNDVVTIEPAAQSSATLVAAEQRDLRSRIVRVDSRVVSGEISNGFLEQDRSTFSVNTPTRAINNMLSFVNTVSDTPISANTTKLLQALSMLSSRKTNLQFAYLAPLSKASRIESKLDCRVNLNGSNNLMVVARLQYVMDF